MKPSSISKGTEGYIIKELDKFAIGNLVPHPYHWKVWVIGGKLGGQGIECVAIVKTDKLAYMLRKELELDGKIVNITRGNVTGLSVHPDTVLPDTVLPD